jgi:hypothetical protein
MAANHSLSTKLEIQIRNEKERISQRIARLNELHEQFLIKICPLKTGDRIGIETERGSETGEVTDVCYYENDGFCMNMNPAASSGWRVRGRFLNKKNRALSVRPFSLNSFEHSLVDGVWRKKPPSLSS